jgi:hypothetical protein
LADVVAVIAGAVGEGFLGIAGFLSESPENNSKGAFRVEESPGLGWLSWHGLTVDPYPQLCDPPIVCIIPTLLFLE